MEEKAVLLTQDAYDELKAELAKREGSLREEIAAKIAAAGKKEICLKTAVIRRLAKSRARMKGALTS